MLQGFWGPGCHLNTLIDLANIALASKGSLKAICFFSEDYRNIGCHWFDEFQKVRTFFFSENRAAGVSGHLAAIQAL